jgi:beta-mannosidase
LQGRWVVAAVTPGRACCPSDLDALDLDWLACEGPMTAAAALRAAGQWDADRPRDVAADDWWYRCRFTLSVGDAPIRLRFQGLATIADVWLNGTPILHSTSMFVAHTVAVDHLDGHEHELQLRFHALAPLLSVRRPRPQWRSALVARQQLRHFRTTLLGRTSTWWPAVAPVGPWRPVLVEPASPLRVEHTDLRTELRGDEGIVRVELAACETGAAPVDGVLRVGRFAAPISCEPRPDGTIALLATVRIPHPERWWPHTHGPQPLYPVELSIKVGGEEVNLDLGRTGFRTLEVQRGSDGKGFGLAINHAPVFCRGVCWTPLDIAGLGGNRADYRTALDQLRDAGMNIIRVPGSMVYETDDFHDLCDELGILLWQDFMFANMDYPLGGDNQAFSRDVSLEVRQRLAALQGRPSFAVCCGNSEVEQQAAMMGVPRGQWTQSFFTDVLPALVASLTPGVAWVPSTPTGGVYPFQPDEGVSHYYGVGAYRRALHDARRAGVRFASECLAFANLPDDSCLDGHDGDSRARWNDQPPSLRVPRDAGAEWDFAQVRDHYVALLFGVDPPTLLHDDPERYRVLGRVAVGEVMLQTFAEWRRPGSSCRGGLVWFARDFSPQAGWGIVDSSGRAKSAYWFLKRALAPLALVAVDEGLNGLGLHAINDTPDRLEAELRVALYREGCPFGGPAATRLTIPARSARTVSAGGLFDRFHDMTNAHRFGPRGHDVVAASLVDPASGDVVAAAYYYPYGLSSVRDSRLQLAARAEPIVGGYALVLEADRFAHAVVVEADGFVPDDNYLNLEPRQPRRLVLRADGRRVLAGRISALNGVGSVPIVCGEPRDGD